MAIYLLLLGFVGIAGGLAWYLLAHDRGEREPVGALWLAAGLGLLGGIAAAVLETSLVAIQNLQGGAPLGAVFSTAMAVGIIEEVCKFLPLSLVLYRKRFFNEHTDGVIYFALAGLGFGLPENILYTLQYGAQAGLGRVLLTPFFHAAITGTVGYFLIRQKLGKKPVYWVGVPLVGAILLHGLYDFGLASAHPLLMASSILITLLLSGSIFLLLLRANQLDQDEGRSAVGHNDFCRNCGQPNPKHHLYCVHCGNYA
jgi:RsiW-degrading membrane proteinase PrsW (M82 family)